MNILMGPNGKVEAQWALCLGLCPQPSYSLWDCCVKGQKSMYLWSDKDFHPLLCSVQSLSHVWFFVTPWTATCQASLSFTPTPRACSNSCTLSRWCHPAISSSIVPFSSCFQSFRVSGSFPMSQFFVSSGKIIGTSALASVLPIIQVWFPLG